MRKLTLLVPLVLIAAGVVACADEQTAFNDLDRLRILGIQASRPWVQEGEMTTLDYLAVNNDPNIEDEDLRVRWHFCPVQADSTVGFECVVQDAEQFALFLGDDALPLLATSTTTEFGLLVSTDPVVDLPFLFPAETIANLCAMLDDIDLPPFVTRPECNGRFPVTIYLEIGPRLQAGTDETAIDPLLREVGFRTIDLLYDTTLEANPPNQNPRIDSLSIARQGTGMFIETSSTVPTVLQFDRTYDLRIDVSDNQSERFEPSDDDIPDRESLTVTWFIEGGSTDSTRTGFLPADDSDFSDLTDNEWTTPKRADFADRFGEDRRDARLFLVIRDNRGGLSWLIRDVRFNDAEGL